MSFRSDTYIQANRRLIQHLRIMSFYSSVTPKVIQFFRELVGKRREFQQLFPLDKMLHLDIKKDSLNYDDIMCMWSPYVSDEHLSKLFYQTNRAITTKSDKLVIAKLHQHQLCFHWMKIFIPQLSSRFANFQLKCHMIHLINLLQDSESETHPKIVKDIIAEHTQLPDLVDNSHFFQSTTAQMHGHVSKSNAKVSNYYITDNTYSLELILTEFLSTLIEPEHLNNMNSFSLFLESSSSSGDMKMNEYKRKQSTQGNYGSTYQKRSSPQQGLQSQSKFSLGNTIANLLNASKPLEDFNAHLTTEKVHERHIWTGEYATLRQLTMNLNQAFQWNIGLIVFDDVECKKGVWIPGDIKYSEQSCIDPLFLILIKESKSDTQNKFKLCAFNPIEEFNMLWRFKDQRYFEMLWPMYRVQNVFSHLYTHTMRDNIWNTTPWNPVVFTS